MTLENLKKLNKPALIQICTDLGIEVLAEQVKADLVKNISEHADWTSHASYESGSDEPPVAKAKGDDEPGPELSDEEIKIAELQEECVQREIAMTGEETLEELQLLLSDADAVVVAAAEHDSAVQAAKENGVSIPEGSTTQEILDLIIEKKAREAHMKEVNESEEAAMKAHLEKGVTLEYLQKVTSHLIDATNQMIRQQDREKKSTDRFYKATKDLARMRAEVYIR